MTTPDQMKGSAPYARYLDNECGPGAKVTYPTAIPGAGKSREIPSSRRPSGGGSGSGGTGGAGRSRTRRRKGDDQRDMAGETMRRLQQLITGLEAAYGLDNEGLTSSGSSLSEGDLDAALSTALGAEAPTQQVPITGTTSIG